MYLYHFGLQQLPFTLTPNTQFYFGLPSHNEALCVLKTALFSGEGFIKVTGEVGTGKTLLCRKLLNEMPKGFVAAYIPNPYLSPSELRHAVASELQVELPHKSDQQEFTQAIQKRLVEIRKSGKAAVLIIDEAQALSDESIEALRLMTNLETESTKLLQVILFGQPELNEKLSQPKLRQLLQRITFSYNLNHMTADQIHQYVNHRMEVAGYSQDKQAFSKSVSKRLYKASQGTPRIVNTLCNKALMLAYGEGTRIITKKFVNIAIKDTESAHKTSISRWLKFGLTGLIGLALVISIFVSQPQNSAYREVLSAALGWET